ncbi:MAG TPA: hypothetical protein VMD03_03500 [Steroidobacteraceae bacterium]|nr:hypothetical protein [Steroidobacteraceae bacterium]
MAMRFGRKGIERATGYTLAGWLLRAAACAVSLAGFATASGAAADGLHYRLIKSVTLGGENGWDYLTVDPDARRLFIARDTHVMVVDTASGMPVGDIAGLAHVHGVALAGDRGYISDGGANSVVVFDRRTLAKVGEIRAGTGPDGILYDPFSHRVFAFNGRSGDATAIDAATGQVVGTVPLGGKPEAAASDDRGVIYVNIEDKGAVAAFDSKTLAVRRRWPLAPCSNPSGMAIDMAHERLFSGCRNALIAVSDTRSGTVVTTIPIGQGVDANRFDSDDGLVFSSNGFSGTLTVAREVTPNDYRVLENVPTARSARTMALDSKTHRVYLVAADIKPIPNPQPHGRRFTVVRGTFRVLILAPTG